MEAGNAVMAGALPEHMPVIVAGVRGPLRELLPDDDGAEVPRAFTFEAPEASKLDELAPKFTSPDNIWIVVAGGTAGKFSAVIPGWVIGHPGSQPVTELIS